MATMNEMQWLQELQSFLNVLLQPILPDQGDRYKYLDVNAMKIWALAFTHETVSPSENYEVLEYLGDAKLKSVFPQYLVNRHPGLHIGEYTELNVAYMSKIKQAELARQMGLSRYIRVTGMDKAILNLETDVFESFFGALNEIANMLVYGLGEAVCMKMVVHLFKDIKLDLSKGRGSAKTQVIQMFVRFDLPKPDEVVDDSDKYSPKFSVVLTREHLDFLRS